MQHKLLRRALFLVIAVCWISTGCRTYKQVSPPQDELFTNDDIIRYLDGYDMYMHNGHSTWRIVDPKIQDNTLTGRIVPTDSTKRGSSTKDRRNDIDIYTDKTLAASDSSAQARVT